MNFLKFGFLLLTLIVFFSNCTSDGTASTKDVATSICECVQPVIEVNNEIQALGKAGKIEEMTKLYAKAETTFEMSIVCSQKHMNEKINKTELKKALVEDCEVIERMADDLIRKLK